jgi:hypothetical protein
VYYKYLWLAVEKLQSEWLLLGALLQPERPATPAPTAGMALGKDVEGGGRPQAGSDQGQRRGHQGGSKPVASSQAQISKKFFKNA